MLKKSTIKQPAPTASVRMLRKHRQVLMFNDKEMEVISHFCTKYKIESKPRFFRESIISAIFQKMEEDHPKLF